MINHFILQGRLVDNVKPVTDTMAKARLVCNRGKDDKDTLFMDVVFYNNVADRAKKYLHKGRVIIATGPLTSRQYEGKTYYEIKANDFEFVDSKKPESNETTFQDSFETTIPESIEF
jgi:single-stranded DNA-binding protein